MEEIAKIQAARMNVAPLVNSRAVTVSLTLSKGVLPNRNSRFRCSSRMWDGRTGWFKVLGEANLFLGVGLWLVQGWRRRKAWEKGNRSTSSRQL
jgi:hypothetical protein